MSLDDIVEAVAFVAFLFFCSCLAALSYLLWNTVL